ncbi:NodT family efflux transporter outer membrane factor (OMF) lipoprotein [Pseudoduganella flava]|uniref:Efflux transporter outer membrane subunit n=1 Tax=Pseudoduganella flava TaxID=871742 RepID=A0A562PLG4_9BURK|nr:efflux transporter outer membrane subunit [Pseudoduganella flava]QGZ41043.1 efflux transporter outer membrane subunit [Pseudoduganella flava]TWI45259.1 NodT family efflux transporter outer membrane factor (OMF) lipoprotein [Pseudoduganella flava]
MYASSNHPRLRRRGALLLFSLVAALSGCTTAGPDYHAPTVSVPANWIEDHRATTASDEEGLRTWWRSFDDPMLDSLVDQTLARNQDLDIALARLRQARAERVQIASATGLHVSAGGSGETRRSSKALGGQPGGESRTWQLGFDASWELDLFGGTRRAVEAADAGIAALTEDRRALQVSLVAELVSNYAGLRATQLRLGIAHANIRTLVEAERLAEQSQRTGFGTLATVMQARAERELAEAQPPLMDADIARFSHAIGVLAGGFPGDWHAALAAPAPALPRPARLPLSLPSEVIRQRPDLRADERRLAAATAQIGVAEAERVPKFSIPLGIGTTASVIHRLFSSASMAWVAGVQVSQSLYDGGRAQAGVAGAQANADAARLVYERDVRLALRDVEDALTGWTSERQRQASLRLAVADSQQALDHATRLYGRGLSAYLPVLVAQRTVNQARDELALSQWEEVRGVIALYKSLGAGWSEADQAGELEKAAAR